MERDGDSVGGEEHRDHAELAQPRADLGHEHLPHVAAGLRQDRAALLGMHPEPAQLAPERPDHDREHDHDDDRNEHGEPAMLIEQ